MTSTQAEIDAANAVTTALLDKLRVTYSEPKSIPINKVDKEASIQSQARFRAIDPENVQRIVDGIKAGDTMPHSIYLPKGRSYVIVAGLHRFEAHVETKKVPSAYILDADTPEVVIDQIMVATNVHGLPMSKSEMMEWAMTFMDRGLSASETAKIVKLGASDIQGERSRRRADARAIELGVNLNDWNRLSGTAKRRFDNVRDDDVFKVAANLAGEAGMNFEAVRLFVNSVNKLSTTRAQLAFVKEESERLREEIQLTMGGRLGSKEENGKNIAPVALQVQRFAKATAKPTIDSVVESFLGLPMEMRPGVIEQIETTGNHLFLLSEALKTAALPKTRAKSTRTTAKV